VKFQALRHLARDWEAFGKTDPLFGILSDPTKYGGKWDVAEFFASGRAHVRKLFDTLASRNIRFDRGACLDFGCGVGRLTVALAEPFERTVGVDVAPSMIQRAREFHGAGSKCQFVVNRSADLGQFAASTFDFVHSCLVLQHIPPEISLGYVSEFFRVAKDDGLVVFQLPAETRTEAEITSMHALPDAGYAAQLMVLEPPMSLGAAEARSLPVRVTNVSLAAWPHDIPAGRHICIANHWRHDDGSEAVADDGRARLPRTVAPGDSIEVALTITAPGEAGHYLLEIDLVQEKICWFAQKGSPTLRLPVVVTSSSPGFGKPPSAGLDVAASPAASRASRLGLVRRWLRPERRPSFSMYTVARPEVEAVIRASGGELIEAIDDNAAGSGWRSYTYVCRRLRS
jgi:SAM-dependent methyltransferase